MAARPSVLDRIAYTVGSLTARLSAAYKAGSGTNWDRLNRVTAQAAENRGVPDLSKYNDQGRAYEQVVWFYIGTDRVATDCALTALNVFHYVNEKKTAIVDHPIERLMRTPGDDLTQFEFMYQTIGFLWVNGNAYWYLDGPPGGAPGQVMILRPDRMRIVPGADSSRRVAGYVYVVDGMEVPLQPEEVVHFKLWNPRDDYYGLSRAQAGRYGLLTDLAMEAWNYNNFGENKATPAGIVNIEDFVSDADYERIQREFRETYGGTKRATAFTRGGKVTWQDMGLSQKDMDFILGRQFNKEQILQLCGVWPGFLDKNATEANAIAGETAYTGKTVWPTMVRIAQKVGRSIGPFFGDDLIIEPDDIRVKDKQQELNEIKAAESHLTINEIREKYFDMEAVDWGDIPATGAAAAAITGQSVGFDRVPKETRQIPGDAAAQAEEAQAEAVNRLAAGKTIDIYADVPRVYMTRAARKELEQFARYASKGKDIEIFDFQATPLPVQIAVKALADIEALDLLSTKAATESAAEPRAKTRLARQAAGDIADYFDGLVARLVKGIRHVNAPSSGKSLPDLSRFLSYFDRSFWSNELKQLASAFLPFIEDLVTAGFEDAADSLHMASGVSVDPASSQTLAARWAAQYTDAVLKGFNSTTQDGVGAILERYIATPDATIPDLVAAIQESKLFAVERARMVAVTEATRAYGAGNYLAGEALAETAGVKVAVKQSDYGNLLPAHPNCRCGVSAEFVYDDQDAIAGLDYRWYTVRDAAGQDCDICGPRDGKLISEVVAGGL